MRLRNVKNAKEIVSNIKVNIMNYLIIINQSV